MIPSPQPPDLLREELGRQAGVLNREAPLRFFATLLGYAVAGLYLPLWFILAMMAANLAAELVSYGLFRDVDALARDPARRRAVIIATFAMEFAFVLPPGLLWQLEDPYAKALAVGLAAGTMMHIATARSIHLPIGLAGATALLTVLVAANTAFWLPRGEWMALGLTSLCVAVAVGYCVAAMVSNNALHRTSAVARHAAQAASDARGRFLAEMSHELRTPLNGILGMADAELRKATDPASRARLGVLVDSARGLDALLNDILDLSAVEEGRMAIRPRAMAPADEVRAVAALFRPATEAAGLALRVGIDPALSMRAMIDGGRLRQCLSNLVSNAIRHGTGATHVTLRAMRVDDVAGQAPLLAVEVEDDGPGLGPEPGSAVPRSPRDQGHGLGLSIARGLAVQMGGDVEARPRAAAGRGACFRLTIALPPAPGPPGALPGALPGAFPGAPADPEAPPECLKGLRVLVVDDVATNRLVALTYLGLLGADAAEAASGTDALCHLGAHPVDVVLLDMNMPDPDGLETFRRIRALPPPAGRVAVIALTADALAAQQAHFRAQGLDGYLSKPVTPERIAAEVRRAMLARAEPAA